MIESEATSVQDVRDVDRDDSYQEKPYVGIQNFPHCPVATVPRNRTML